MDAAHPDDPQTRAHPAAPASPRGPEQFEPPDVERPSSLAPTEAQLEREIPAGRDAGGHDPYAALRLRDYRMYAAG